MSKNDSGRLELVGDRLAYSSEHYGSWEISVPDISFIGEYTNENGPFADDWFLVFVENQERIWKEASMYSDGRQEVLAELGSRLGVKLISDLTTSTSFKSRIMWPADRVGEDLFEFVSTGWFKNRQSLRQDLHGEGPVPN